MLIIQSNTVCEQSQNPIRKQIFGIFLHLLHLSLTHWYIRFVCLRAIPFQCAHTHWIIIQSFCTRCYRCLFFYIIALSLPISCLALFVYFCLLFWDFGWFYHISPKFYLLLHICASYLASFFLFLSLFSLLFPLYIFTCMLFNFIVIFAWSNFDLSMHFKHFGIFPTFRCIFIRIGFWFFSRIHMTSSIVYPRLNRKTLGIEGTNELHFSLQVICTMYVQVEHCMQQYR